MESYKTSGVCAKEIKLDVEDGVILDVEIVGGCDGNRKALAALVKGKKVPDIISTLKGIKCGLKSTSCADQLAQILEK